MPLLRYLFLASLMLSIAASSSDGGAAEQQPMDPGDFTPAPNTVPAFPVVQQQAANQTCRLDLSDELFGGVGEACGRNLDRGRCCPVLAAWLFAAHARSALQISQSSPSPSQPSDLQPMMPDDSQRCVDSLNDSLRKRDIHLPRPNSTCDAVLCFCGIRLHQIGSLSCPAAFNLSSSAVAGGLRNVTPTAAVRNLEKNCRNSSYAGCTRCLQSLDKLKGEDAGNERASKMFGRDCQLMGLTWLLARNKTAYIPTVSAVLRAIMYSSHPPHQSSTTTTIKCSPDQENMPLAVDSLQFQKLSSSFAPHFSSFYIPILVLSSLVVSFAHGTAFL
ncbi:hypothetical protein QJS04_geneDACA003205 [Acorus gramineus]|uniref:SPARK domain-containing protein n=1 Tax=Acorus gramineus TaxID=55184 RepID=A0AAV9BVN3_ACOGR|nr:hypothetical protein QJS04_geneDACA003205 [Acorus gramineus]